jgi:ribonucleoside-diphosphate reductase alpha subunit
MSYVTKRDGMKEKVHFDKITERVNRLINPKELQGLDLPWLDLEKESQYLDPVLVAQKVVANLFSGITTEMLDIESAEICVNLSTTHPLYGTLGGRILVSNLHKKTLNNFSSKMTALKDSLDPEWYKWVEANSEELDKIVNYNLDYVYDYFGFKTLEKSYLLKLNGTIIERPQDMLLRTAATLQMGNMEMIKKTYEYMSLGYYTHASPTLYNAGTHRMQCSSCFLLGTSDDLSSISTTWNSCAQISKWAGGIGLHVSNIRGKDSIIKGTGGRSNGLVPFLKVFNEIARWIDQGGRRPGSIAVYLEPHHPDIFDFIELRKNFGSETERARDLFLALWVSDLFMKQVEADGDWYLLSSDECTGLTDVYGDEYETLYWKYVNEGKYRKKVSARKLWVAIIESQIETGLPYICYKDSINRKSNQKNIGTIKSSNLCAEIVQYSDDKEYAVCNLASIALKPFIDMHKFNSEEYTIYSKPNCKYCTFAKTYLDSHNVKYTEMPFTNENLAELKKLLNRSSDSITFPQIFINNDAAPKYVGGWSELYKYTGGKFNWDKLYQTAYLATVNLNQVIDINYYPVPQTKFSNVRHRPIGLGIQGMADALVLMRVPFDSEDAVMINSQVMETIYIASITASNDMARNRYEDMKTLMTYFNSSDTSYPEYYDSSLTLSDTDMNRLYHKLRPNKWELSRNLDSTTLGAYSSFEGSPFSEGKFQFDLWNEMTENKVTPYFKNKWDQLRQDVIKYGTRNSLLTALMPTASTSQILGNNECFEFFTNNIYTRKTQAGSFVLVNKYLVNDMLRIGMWDKNMKDKIIAMNGSIQSNDEIPSEFKALYKTIWEIKQVWVLKAAAARQPFVDQTQSMNIFMGEPDYQRLGSSHFWAWKNGLKTGMYYLRTKPSADAIKFTIDPNLVKAATTEVKECDTCSA